MFQVAIIVSTYLWEMFHILSLNLAMAIVSGDAMMIASDLEAVRSDRHMCAGIGAAINFFYLASGSLTFVMAHAIFKSITGKVTRDDLTTRAGQNLLGLNFPTRT